MRCRETPGTGTSQPKILSRAHPTIQQQPADPEHNLYAVREAELENTPKVGNLTRKEGHRGQDLRRAQRCRPQNE